MTTEAEREYAEARAAYREAIARIVEAKKYVPETPRDRRRREKREQLAAPPPAEVSWLLEAGKETLLKRAKVKIRNDIIAALGTVTLHEP